MQDKAKRVTKESLLAEIDEQWKALQSMQKDLRELWVKAAGLPEEGGSVAAPDWSILRAGQAAGMEAKRG